MQISFEAIKKATNGVIDTFVENGRLNFRRFTDKQLKYFADTLNSMNKPSKATATSSVIIDFYTDATELKGSFYCTRATTRAQCFLDVYVNGQMVTHAGEMLNEEKADFNLTFNTYLGDGEKRVTIFLPNLFKAELQSLTLKGGQKFTPVKKDKNVIFFGDSITQGYTSDFASYTYVNRLAYKNNWKALNMGLGATIFDCADLDENLPFAPEEIFIAYGTNDWIKSPNLSGLMSEYLTKLQSIYKGVKINLITPVWRGDVTEVQNGNGEKQSFSDLQAQIKGVAKEFDNLTVIDGLKLIPHYPDYFREDLLHPNDLGFLLYAESLTKELEL